METSLPNKESLSNVSSVTSPSNFPKKPFQQILFFLFGLFLLSGFFISGYFLGRRVVTPFPPTPTLSPAPIPSLPSPPVTTWLKAYENQSVTLEYPTGWHVYRQWILNRENAPITTYLNPSPIYYVDPGEGGTAAITIVFSFGYRDPQAKLTELLNQAREHIRNLNETTFTVNNVTFYRLEGSDFFEPIGNYKILQYYALLPSREITNSKVISFVLNNYAMEKAEGYAQILDHVVRTMTFQ